jgi:Xaa-Pro aminopeptidase
MLIREKVEQAIQILNEYDIDCWLTFVRESDMVHDPMLDFLITSHVTWQSAFLITRTGDTHAIVGQMDRATVEDLGIYRYLQSYIEGMKEPLVRTLREIQPRTIAVNYSQSSEVCDGLTHGMYLTLAEWLEEAGLAERLISSERICSSLKARKTPEEIARIKRAIFHTEEIFRQAHGFIRPGVTERQIAEFMIAEVKLRGLELGWGQGHCPAVFTGPATAEAHYQPTNRIVERGHVLNMDFGVRCEDYVSDLQRTFYVLEENQTAAPPEVQRGFNTLLEAIESARKAIHPGVQGIEIDRIAREMIVAGGYEEYPHALGHQVGRFAHDGTALLGPAWPKYLQRPFERLEEGMVFTLEPRLKAPGRGVVTIEEMILVTGEGARYLSEPQRTLLLI